MTELSSLSHIFLPQHIDIQCIIDTKLVDFADASQKGYATSVFLHVMDNLGNVRVHFITCKTKVAPLKSLKLDASSTIPRLELYVALLLARLSIVLVWLTKEQKYLNIFVTNRVAKIHSLILDCEQIHVRSLDNPADPASRGMLHK